MVKSKKIRCEVQNEENLQWKKSEEGFMNWGDDSQKLQCCTGRHELDFC